MPANKGLAEYSIPAASTITPLFDPYKSTAYEKGIFLNSPPLPQYSPKFSPATSPQVTEGV